MDTIFTHVWEDSSVRLRLRTLVVGYDRERILLSYGLTIPAFAGTYCLLEIVDIFGISLQELTLLIVILGGLVPGLAAGQAYFNAGLLPSLALGVMPFFAFRLWWYASGRCWFCPQSTAEIFQKGLMQTLYFATPAAAVGFTIGMTIGIVSGP